MSVPRVHICLECAKTIQNGAEGIAKHYTPDEGGCPAMELRSINWMLAHDIPKGEGAAERIATLKRRRIALTLRAERAGRGDALSNEVPAEVSETVRGIMDAAAERASRVSARQRLAIAPDA